MAGIEDDRRENADVEGPEAGSSSYQVQNENSGTAYAGPGEDLYGIGALNGTFDEH